MPLRVLPREDDSHWFRECERELATRINVETGPLWRITILRDNDVCEILLCFSHIIADAHAAFLVLRDLLSAAPAEGLPELPAFEELVPLESPELLEQWWSRKTTEKLHAIPTHELLANLPAVGPTRLLCNAVASEILLRSRTEGVSVHCAIAAAALLALAGPSPELVRCRHIMSLRRFAEPAMTGDLGLCISQFTTSHIVSAAADFWELARSVRSEMQTAIASGEAYHRLLDSMTTLNAGAPPREEAGPSVTISNLGRVTVPPQVAEAHFAGSVVTDSPVVSTVTVNGKMSWIFSYPATWARANEAAEISGAAARILASVC